MSAPFAIPMKQQFSNAPLIGSILIALLVCAGWLLTDPNWSKSDSGIFNTHQSWITMLIVFLIAAVAGFYAVKWWVR